MILVFWGVCFERFVLMKREYIATHFLNIYRLVRALRTSSLRAATLLAYPNHFVTSDRVITKATSSSRTHTRKETRHKSRLKAFFTFLHETPSHTPPPPHTQPPTQKKNLSKSHKNYATPTSPKKKRRSFPPLVQHKNGTCFICGSSQQLNRRDLRWGRRKAPATAVR